MIRNAGKHDPSRYDTKQAGFTLIELLVVMAITGVIMGAVYTTFASQQKSYLAQTAISAMQQNLRSSMYNLKRDIRMAGYDPTGNADAGIVTQAADSIRISMDLTDGTGTGDPDGDTGDSGEDVTYALDGDPDGDGIHHLVRTVVGGGAVLAAENIDHLDFVYLDGDGVETATLSSIRSVQITVIARTGRPDPGYTNNEVFQNQNGDVVYTAPGDAYRRQALTAEVKCRNLGLD